MSEESWQLSAIKRWWIPQRLFTILVHCCRLIGSDASEHPWLSFLLTTEAFHYHDIGRALYGKKENCKACKSR